MDGDDAGRDHSGVVVVAIVDVAGVPEALPLVEAVPHQEDFYDFEARYETGRTSLVRDDEYALA